MSDRRIEPRTAAARSTRPSRTRDALRDRRRIQLRQRSATGPLARLPRSSGPVDADAYNRDPHLGARRRRAVRARRRPRDRGGHVCARRHPRHRARSKILLWARRNLELARSADRDPGGRKARRTREDVRLVLPGPSGRTLRQPDVDDRSGAATRRRARHSGQARLLQRGMGAVRGARRDGWPRPTSAVSAHFDDIETRFAFRTRLLDYFWAGLPIVTTDGDVLGDLVLEAALGRPFGPATWMHGRGARMTCLAMTIGMSAIRGTRCSGARQFHWSRVTEPLVGLVGTNGRRVALPARIRANAIAELPPGASSRSDTAGRRGAGPRRSSFEPRHG